jgi:hypothetical protein
MNTIIVVATRALLLEGRRIEPGTKLHVAALVAAELLASGRAVLADDSDLPEVIAARRADVAAALRLAGRPWAGPEPTGGWQRMVH